MTRGVARLGGIVLALVAIVAGVLVGRVIEAIAVAAVLFAAWTSVRRLLTVPDDTIPGPSAGRTG